MKFKIPIVVKLIFLTVSILVASTALFVKTSTDKLTETLQFREEDANKYSAKSKATEVENILYSTREKIQSNATLLLDSIFKSKTSPPTTIPLSRSVLFLKIEPRQNTKISSATDKPAIKTKRVSVVNSKKPCAGSAVACARVNRKGANKPVRVM